MSLIDVRGPADFAAVFGVSRETTERLVLYESLLRTWQKAINLVAPKSLEHVWQRHFADSAQLAGLADDVRTWVDLGSGAGFPGLVIAILKAETGGASVVLVESDVRKCAFLREVVRQTGIGGRVAVDILTGRIESAQTQAKLGTPDVVMARALAPLDRLFGYAQPVFGVRTFGLFSKGREAEAEVAVARKMWDFDAGFVASRTEPQAQIIVVRNLVRREAGRS